MEEKGRGDRDLYAVVMPRFRIRAYANGKCICQESVIKKYLDRYQQLRQCSTVHLKDNRFNRTSTKPLWFHL